MNPTVSVILLTTLCGMGQGVFVMVLLGHLAGATPHFLILGTIASLLLCGAGLAASFFHLGRPERAWRAIAQCRTSWLSRECIALPLFMALVFAYGFLGLTGGRGATLIGTLALFACIALWICTGMIYTCIRFIAEWASGYTLANFVLISLATGATLALNLALFSDLSMIHTFGYASLVFTTIAGLVRLGSLRRNARLVPESTLQSAIGIGHPVITQRSMGATGGTFNTREFFHGRTLDFLRSTRRLFLWFTFVLPPIAVLLALFGAAAAIAVPLALLLQTIGLMVERWFFFAQANHAQNLYYQVVS